MTLSADPPDAHSAPVHPEHDLAHLDKAHQPWFARLGRFAGRRRRPVMLTWLLVALIAAPLAITVGNALSGAGWEAGGSTSVTVRDELRRDFPQIGAESAVVVVHQDTPVSQDPAAVQQLVASLATAPGAAQVVDPLTMPAEAGLVSQDGTTVLIPVDLYATKDAERPESAGKLIDWLVEPAASEPELLTANSLPSGTTRTTRATASDFADPLALTVSVCTPTCSTRTGTCTPFTSPAPSCTSSVVGPSAVYQPPGSSCTCTVCGVDR